MMIHYNQNPLNSVVEFDVYDLDKLRLKLIIEELEERIYGAAYHLESGERLSPAAALNALDLGGLDDEPFKKRIDELMEISMSALSGTHVGDCTCQPCLCLKCHAEQLMGIDTIKGLGKHEAHYIERAFENGETLDQAIEWLMNYKPAHGDVWLEYPSEEFERHVPHWIKQAHRAADWLIGYRQQHCFTDAVY